MDFYATKGITTPVERIGWPDQFIEHASSVGHLRHKYGLSVDNTVAKVEERINESSVTELAISAA